jgi:hypothetical protein
MEINWQSVFYFSASFMMIIVSITSLWLLRLIFTASKVINNLSSTVHKWSNVVDDIRYFKKGMKLTVLRFLLTILEKGGEK